MTGHSKETGVDNPQHTVLGLFPETRVLLKRLGVVLLAEAVILAAGVAFLLILHGLVFALILSARYWRPPFDLWVRVLRDPEYAWVFTPVPMTWWRVLFFIVNMTVRLGMIAVGLWIIFKVGFCGQNFICLLAK